MGLINRDANVRVYSWPTGLPSGPLRYQLGLAQPSPTRPHINGKRRTIVTGGEDFSETGLKQSLLV